VSSGLGLPVTWMMTLLLLFHLVWQVGELRGGWWRA